jgi:hypothetical protein
MIYMDIYYIIYILYYIIYRYGLITLDWFNQYVWTSQDLANTYGGISTNIKNNMLSPTKLGFDRQTQRSSLTKPNKIGVEHQHVRISQTNMMEMIGMIGMNGMMGMVFFCFTSQGPNDCWKCYLM